MVMAFSHRAAQAAYLAHATGIVVPTGSFGLPGDALGVDPL
jgi:hypothetical protein